MSFKTLFENLMGIESGVEEEPELDDPPMFNLTIKIVNYTKRFEDSIAFRADRFIEMHGLAIHNARLLEGDWQVTESGSLKRYRKEGAAVIEADLDIDTNLSGLLILERLWRREIEDADERSHTDLHYNGRVSYVRVDKKGFYLDDIRRDFEFDQLTKGWAISAEPATMPAQIPHQS